MEKKKIRVLMVPSDLQGVGSFRNIWPSQSIQKNYSDEFDVDIDAFVDVDRIDYLKSFDIIHFHRMFGSHDKMAEVTKKLSDAGVIMVMDIDDYWRPPVTHPLYELVMKDELDKKTLESFKHAHYITTTTDIYAEHIKKLNKNVQVVPNALDMTKDMWTSGPVENKSGKCRIAMICGSSHKHDIELLTRSMNILNNSNDLSGKYQIILCGFDTRGSITEILPNNERRTRKILPQETVWCDFERTFTSNYSLIKDPDYLKWLNKIKREDYPGEYEQDYVRRWTLPLTHYGKHYDYCDVCLAPLQEFEMVKDAKGTIRQQPHYFNEVKSELKIIEAGMKKKALIAQDYSIYKKLLVNGETALLVNDNEKGWYKAMAKLIREPELREKLANNLHEYVKEKYELKIVTGQRMEFYKRIVEERDKKQLPTRPADEIKKVPTENVFDKGSHQTAGLINQIIEKELGLRK